MLGNQYFLTGQYKDALTQFEKVLLVYPTNIFVKRKIITCYIQTKQVQKALKLFIELITDNTGLVIENEFSNEGCPCQQIIYELENYQSTLVETERLSALGMLWFFCEISKSQKYFNKLFKKNPTNHFYQKITETIKTHSLKYIKEQ
jgi:tetratricopeptide (TPR) repeat protein